MAKSPNQISEPFTVSGYDMQMTVSKYQLLGRTIYRMDFPDGRPPLALTYAKREGGDRFWTNMPEGRQEEAEKFGPLIHEQEDRGAGEGVQSVLL